MSNEKVPNRKAYMAAYYAANAEKIAARKVWQTPERKAYMKAWQAANPRDRRAYKKAYDAANAERIAAYRAANQEKKSARDAERYKANRERILAQVMARAETMREQLAAYGRRYGAANRDQMRANASRRQARIRGAGGSHTLAEWRAKCEEYGHRCAYCGEAKKLTRDHVVAVSCGGSDDIENIVPACMSCNSRKRTRSAEEFGRRIAAASN